MNPAALPLRDIASIGKLLEAHAGLHALLLHVESLGLPDCWIGAGFIRNTVWDVLHGHEIDITRLNDVDVVFLDPSNPQKGGMLLSRTRLRRLLPAFVGKSRTRPACISAMVMRLMPALSTLSAGFLKPPPPSRPGRSMAGSR
ncbi:nucleotidyltransferase family protein [Microvirga aerilata]|uniref:Nucleotidyltransferase family protein n=1 Tax=Microvirga aerilata TaxID=670292 RepID=A0A937D412_9HYPH|nr:nucleotidyltransferase family protein [Microvirga aerilata]